MFRKINKIIGLLRNYKITYLVPYLNVKHEGVDW